MDEVYYSKYTNLFDYVISVTYQQNYLNCWGLAKDDVHNGFSYYCAHRLDYC